MLVRPGLSQARNLRRAGSIRGTIATPTSRESNLKASARMYAPQMRDPLVAAAIAIVGGPLGVMVNGNVMCDHLPDQPLSLSRLPLIPRCYDIALE